MFYLRWCLALLCFGLWAAAAWANGEILFGKKWREAERRPSMVMFIGALFAALALKALPYPLPRATSISVWLLLSLLDAGSLGFIPLAAWSTLGSLFDRKEP